MEDPGRVEPQLDHIISVESPANVEPQLDHSTQGWYRPRKLPHFDATGRYQAITYRLADSLPRAVLDRLALELDHLDDQTQYEVEKRKRIEAHLDKGYGSCVLRSPQYAALVEDTWKHFDGVKYDLIAWVVMPNHCHVLIKQ